VISSASTSGRAPSGTTTRRRTSSRAASARASAIVVTWVPIVCGPSALASIVTVSPRSERRTAASASGSAPRSVARRTDAA
jgi:hypothetical protein